MLFLEQANFERTKLRYAHLGGARLAGANLHGTSLREAYLEEAELFGANLQESNLSKANLRNAWLFNAHLERADLWGTNFEGAHLLNAHLEGALLRLVKFSQDTELTNIDWRNYVIGEENLGVFSVATDTYRHLKVWHNILGLYDTAGEFFFREMTAKRNAYWWGDRPVPVASIARPIKLKKQICTAT